MKLRNNPAGITVQAPSPIKNIEIEIEAAAIAKKEKSDFCVNDDDG
ncbi:MAG: hypothetical protein KKB25_00885 [Nanoarchaeota archaeon]|nr:hypothetical protein [Nanoarchaeota archaeon]